jgi:hypothetical protein
MGGWIVAELYCIAMSCGAIKGAETAVRTRITTKTRPHAADLDLKTRFSMETKVNLERGATGELPGAETGSGFPCEMPMTVYAAKENITKKTLDGEGFGQRAVFLDYSTEP